MGNSGESAEYFTQYALAVFALLIALAMILAHYFVHI